MQFSILRCYELYVRKGDKVVANPKRSGECFRPVSACFDEFINNSITGYPISTGRSQYYLIKIPISHPYQTCYAIFMILVGDKIFSTHWKWGTLFIFLHRSLYFKILFDGSTWRKSLSLTDTLEKVSTTTLAKLPLKIQLFLLLRDDISCKAEVHTWKLSHCFYFT